MSRLLLIICSLMSMGISYAQTFYINPGRNYCPGSMAVAGYGSSDIKFAADNQFVVRIESTSGPTVSREWSATAVSSYELRFLYPDDIPTGEYRMTLRSSSPALVSIPSQPFLLFPKPKATLRAVQKDVVGPFEPIPIEYSYSGPPEATITLSDGARILAGLYTNTLSATVSQYLVRTAQNTTYTIASVVTETCGNGVGSGEAAVRVSPVGFRLLSVLPAQICAGSQFTIAYSASSPFETGTRFTVQLSTSSDTLVARFPAESTPNGLTAVMPETIPPYDYYLIRVTADKPQVVSTFSSSVAVRRKPAIQLPNSTINIMWGATADLPMTVSGRDPIAITLSDGTVLNRQQWHYFYNPNEAIEQRFSYPVSPTQTTTYRVQSFSTGCGIGPATGAFTVQVGPGLKINSPDKLTACAGTEWQVPVTTQGTIPTTNRFSVRLTYGRPEWPYAVDTLLVPATLTAGALRFVVPTISGSARFRVEGTALASASIWYDLTIQTAPRLTTFQLEESNGQKTLRVAFSGTIPVTFTLNDGSNPVPIPPVGTFGYIIPLKGYPTSTFRVTSMSNVCGVGVVTQQPIQYDNPNPLLIRLNETNPKSICAGTSASIAFDVTGASTAATTYTVQLGTYDYQTRQFVFWQTIGSGTKSPIQITAGAEPFSGTFIRIVTANPLALSEPEPFPVQTPAIASYYPNGKSVPLLYEQIEYSMNLGVSGGVPFSAVISDGKGFRKEFAIGNTTSTSYEFTEPGNYYLESVQNVCGVGTIRSTDTLFVRPFSIATDVRDRSVYCAGDLITVPFTTKGSVPADAVFSVQLSRRRYDGFYDIPSLPSPYPGELLVRLSDTLQHSNRWLASNGSGNSYYVRVVSRNKDVRGGLTPVQVFVRRPIVASLFAGSGTVYDPLQGPVQLRLGAKGSAPFFAFMDNRSYASDSNDDTGQFTDINDTGEATFSIAVAPLQKTTYRLQTVYNQCGYGTATGQVTVTVKAKINLRLGSTYTTGVCPGSLLSLTAVTAGDFETGNQVRIVLSKSSDAVSRSDDRELARFDPTTGPLQVQLPADLVTGPGYYIKVVSTRPDNVVSNAEQIRIVQPATASLQGNTAINTGELTYLKLKLSGGGPYQYELSTGQIGNTEQEGDVMMAVRPNQTTTFTLKSVRNGCGTGRVSGSATVDVQSPTSVTVSLAGSSLSDVCAGGQVRVPLSVSGTVGGSLTYRVQLSGPSGLAFQDIPTVGSAASLTATIPANTPPGEAYRLRVRVLDMDVVSSASPYPINVRSPAGATLGGPTYFESGKPTSLTINLTGSGPWSMILRDSLQNFYLTSAVSPYIYAVYPSRFTTYRLVSVSNSCGVGTVGTPSSVQLGLLTALDPPVNDPEIVLTPNPVISVLTIRYDRSNPIKTVRVTNMQGRLVMSVAGNSKSANTLDLNMEALAAGIYVIQCETDQGIWESRVVK